MFKRAAGTLRRGDYMDSGPTLTRRSRGEGERPMKMRFFGDSYDLVKQILIRSLGVLGRWSVHPMFTDEAVSKDDASRFERFLGAELLSRELLGRDRAEYMALCRQAGHLFLDPDTGIRMEHRPRHAERFVLASELAELARARLNSLTLVFDQSFRRGDRRKDLESKLRRLANSKVSGFAYDSHACFFVIGRNPRLVSRAYGLICLTTGLPENRFAWPTHAKREA